MAGALVDFASKQPVQVVTGEENEIPIFCHRGRLHRFDTVRSLWVERATGLVRILVHNETGKARLVLRQEKTEKLMANMRIAPMTEGIFKLKPIGDKGACEQFIGVCSTDATDGGVRIFFVQFGKPEILQEFHKSFHVARYMNREAVSQELIDPVEVAESKTFWDSFLEAGGLHDQEHFIVIPKPANENEDGTDGTTNDSKDSEQAKTSDSEKISNETGESTKASTDETQSDKTEEAKKSENIEVKTKDAETEKTEDAEKEKTEDAETEKTEESKKEPETKEVAEAEPAEKIESKVEVTESVEEVKEMEVKDTATTTEKNE